MRALLILAAALFAGGAAAQSYLPLGDDDSWSYGYIVYPPTAPPDTVRAEPVSVSEHVTVDGLDYTVIDLPYVPTDTLRVDAEGRVWGRHLGADRLLFDMTAASGATYRVPADPDEGLDYEVTVDREPTRTPAGAFEDAVRFQFHLAEVTDADLSFTFARGVGLVYAGSAWGWETLFEAVVSDVLVTDAADGPLAEAEARAFPNPARGVVTVALPSGSWAAAEVVDVLGRHVAALDVGAGPLRWDAAGRRPGLYVVRAWGPHGEVAVPVVVAR